VCVCVCVLEGETRGSVEQWFETNTVHESLLDGYVRSCLQPNSSAIASFGLVWYGFVRYGTVRYGIDHEGTDRSGPFGAQTNELEWNGNKSGTQCEAGWSLFVSRVSRCLVSLPDSIRFDSSKFDSSRANSFRCASVAIESISSHIAYRASLRSMWFDSVRCGSIASRISHRSVPFVRSFFFSPPVPLNSPRAVLLGLAWLGVCLSISTSTSTSIHTTPSIDPSIHQSIHLSIYLSLHRSIDRFSLAATTSYCFCLTSFDSILLYSIVLYCIVFYCIV